MKSNAIKVILIILVLLLCNADAIAQQQRAKQAYIMIKPDKLITGEIITVRDSIVIVAEFDAFSENYMLNNLDSLILLNCKTIDYIKINEPVKTTENRTNFAYFGGIAGAGFYASKQIGSEKFKPVDLLAIPIGIVAGYLFGLMLDAMKQFPETVIYPDCSDENRQTILNYSRYSKGEPRKIREAIDKHLR